MFIQDHGIKYFKIEWQIKSRNWLDTRFILIKNQTNELLSRDICSTSALQGSKVLFLCETSRWSWHQQSRMKRYNSTLPCISWRWSHHARIFIWEQMMPTFSSICRQKTHRGSKNYDSKSKSTRFFVLSLFFSVFRWE